MAARKKAAKKAAPRAASAARRPLGKPRVAAAGGARKGATKKVAAPKAAAKKVKPAASAGRVVEAPTGAKARPTRARPAAAAAQPPVEGAVAEGDRAPSFELLDQDGKAVSSGSLKGKPYVLFFYPKDNTPGCTTEACGFRDAFAQFEKAGARIIGVSPDSVASHQGFARKHELPFTLLSDPGQALASAYGVWALKKNYGREYMGIVRSTFLVDASGVIRQAWRGVRVNGHVAAVHAAAAGLS